MNNKNYSVELEYSSREISKREFVKFKEFADCKSIDEISSINEENNEKTLINVSDIFGFKIHNEASENKDYRSFIVVDKDGTKYITSSETFFIKVTDIYEDLKDDGDDIVISVIRKESSNYKGQDFLTCVLV